MEIMAYPKGKPKSEESKRKVSASLKVAWTDEKRAERSLKYSGDGNPFFGMTHSEEARSAISAKVGRPCPPDRRLQIAAQMKGNTHKLGKSQDVSAETKEKIAATKRGHLNHFWRGGVTAEHQRIRRSWEYRAWREAVFSRDGYACQECAAKNGDGRAVYLEADHIKPFSTHPDLRFDVDNGRTLCRPCHRLTPTFGRNAQYA